MSDANTHIKRGHPVVFGLLIVFSIIELSISGWLVARFNKHHNNLSSAISNRTRFLLFASAWTLLGSTIFFFAFLLSALGGLLTSVGSHFLFLFLTWVFWLSGAISITAALDGRLDCSHHFIYCGQQNALEAFAWILWVLSTFALVIVTLRGIASFRRGDGHRGQLVSV